MLKIKHKFHIDFPYITFPSTRQMAFEPIAVDQEMIEERRELGVDWQLDEYTDTVQLEQFWQTVENDLSAEHI